MAAAVAGAFAVRVAGVAISGRVRPDTPLFDGFACIGQAMVGGIVVGAIFLPASPLGDALLIDRTAAVGIAIAVYFLLGRRILVGTLTGVVVLALLGLWRAM
ncbi:MAG: AzlD domain-containing protein [Rhodospirillaceae bacterium]